MYSMVVYIVLLAISLARAENFMVDSGCFPVLFPFFSVMFVRLPGSLVRSYKLVCADVEVQSVWLC